MALADKQSAPTTAGDKVRYVRILCDEHGLGNDVFIYKRRIEAGGLGSDELTYS